MSEVAVDIVIEIAFDVDHPERTVIRTNAKPEMVDEILTAWIVNQMGAGSDGAKPAERDIYRIRIGLVLEDDSFCTESDTGNKSLTCGIVLETLQRLESFEILPLENDPRYADGRPPRERP